MKKHRSVLNAEWSGSFDGLGAITSSNFITSISLPREFGGLGEGASPEDLLLSAISGCFLITFGIVLDKAGVKYESLTVNGELVTRTGPPPVIEEVTLDVQIATGTPVAKLEQLAGRAEGFCLIARVMRESVKKTVRINQQQPRREVRLAAEGIGNGKAEIRI